MRRVRESQRTVGQDTLCVGLLCRDVKKQVRVRHWLAVAAVQREGEEVAGHADHRRLGARWQATSPEDPIVMYAPDVKPPCGASS